MAFNNYPYQPNFFSPQQGLFVPVPSEQVAKSYPVAPGNSVFFKDENLPYCYVKTMSYNQLDRPTFEKYRLVKEEEPVEPKVEYALKQDLDDLRSELELLKKPKRKEAKDE